MQLDEEELTQRSVSDLGTTLGRPLQLADLTQPIFHLGMDNPILTVADYRGPNRLSRAIHDAFPDLDGLYFTSRFANEPSVAIFNRASMLARGAPVPLDRFYYCPVSSMPTTLVTRRLQPDGRVTCRRGTRPVLSATGTAFTRLRQPPNEGGTTPSDST